MLNKKLDGSDITLLDKILSLEGFTADLGAKLADVARSQGIAGTTKMEGGITVSELFKKKFDVVFDKKSKFVIAENKF